MRRPRAVTFSAAFEMAARRGCTAITDIRASGLPQQRRRIRVGGSGGRCAAVTAADAVRRKGTMTKTNIDKEPRAAGRKASWAPASC